MAQWPSGGGHPASGAEGPATKAVRRGVFDSPPVAGEPGIRAEISFAAAEPDERVGEVDVHVVASCVLPPDVVVVLRGTGSAWARVFERTIVAPHASALFVDVPCGPYEATARAGGVESAPQNVDVREGETSTFVLRLPPAATLKGRVKGWQPDVMLGLRVVAVSHSDVEGSACLAAARRRQESAIAADGTFELPSLAPGRNALFLQYPAVTNHARPGGGSYGQPPIPWATVDLGACASMDVEVESPGDAIGGVIVNLDESHGWNGRVVALLFARGEGGTFDGGPSRVATAPQAVRIGCVRPGTYRLLLAQPELGRFLPLPEPIVVEPGAVVAVRARGLVHEGRARVTTVSGDAVASPRWLVVEAGALQWPVRSEDDGTLRLGLPAGSYAIRDAEAPVERPFHWPSPGVLELRFVPDSREEPVDAPSAASGPAVEWLETE